ncbi:MAG: N-acetylglucosamine/diacetylchitobiose ABC transporter substrate-binding protein [Caldilineaceae bacterium]|nr:N-acetylglucosamine/diacetylchitobiose ABC transporter substrate-binding protein [Caldilineaceae bacterium]
MTQKNGLTRRTFLRNTAFLSAGAFLAACAPAAPAAPAAQAPAAAATAAPATEAAAPAVVDPMNPLGLVSGEPLEGIFFEGGFGRGYLDNAADIYRRLHPENPMTVEGIQRVGDQLRPRFIGGNPPDVIDNSGAGNLDQAALVADGELMDLAPLFNAPSLDTPGKTFGETLFPGSQESGKYGGVQYSLQLAYTISGIWHSQSLFTEKGWTYPRTWDDMLAFCEMIKTETDMAPWTYQGKYPQYMVFGVLMPLIYKNGGLQLIIDLDNLVDGAWNNPAVVKSLEQVQALHTNGYIMQGTEGLTHTEAQAEWLNGKAVFLPCGTWLENEMRSMTPDNFDMVVQAVPGGQDESTADSILAWSGEDFIVPTNGKNSVGGMEYLRCLMSVENAKWFAQNVSAIMPVVGGTEGVELSPAVVSASAIAEASGESTFDYSWKNWYTPMADETRDRTGDLLTGRITPEEWIEAVQKKADEVKADSNIPKYERAG